MQTKTADRKNKLGIFLAEKKEGNGPSEKNNITSTSI
jgi:hypothetical protein